MFLPGAKHKKNPKKTKWKQVKCALTASENCFVELTSKYFPIREAGNVRFQIDYLCGCSKKEKERKWCRKKECVLLLLPPSLLLTSLKQWIFTNFCRFFQRMKAKIQKLAINSAHCHYNWRYHPSYVWSDPPLRGSIMSQWLPICPY